MFVISTMSTVLFYALTTFKVVSMVKNVTSGAANNAPKAIMKRGLLLTVTFVVTWIWFVVLGGLGYTEHTIDINIDMVGAIIINAQPIIDGILLLSISNVKVNYLSRWLQAA